MPTSTTSPAPVLVTPAPAINPNLSILAQLPEGVATHTATGPDALQYAISFLSEFGLPDGLLPLQDVVECGFNKDTGYVWITQKKAIVHTFPLISKQVSYGEKVTAFVAKGRLSKLTGVKAKEMLWVSIVDISKDKDGGSLYFKSFSGLGKSFPVTAFVQPGIKGAEIKPAADKPANKLAAKAADKLTGKVRS